MRSPPWQVKGIDPEARHTAREAARRSGVSVGQWLNSVILEQAADEGFGRSSDETGGYEDHGENLAAINERLDDLRHQLELLARNHTAPARPAREDTSHRIAEAILRLNGRLDHIITEGRTASRALEQRVNSVDRALASLSRERLRGTYVGAQPGAYVGDHVGGEPVGIDQAAAEIAARQRALDGEFAAPPSAVLQRPSYAPPSCRADDAVDGLRKDLADIGRSLSEAMPRHAVEALETEVRALVSRLDAGRQAGVDASALAGLEQGLHEVRDALRGLAPAESLVGFDQAVRTLSSKIDTIAAGRDDPAGVKQLEAAIASLRGVVGQVASGDALGALAQEVRALADKIERGVPASDSPDILRTLEKRIATIADAIESVRAQNGRSVSPNLDHLVKSLNDKLEHMQSSPGDRLSRGDQLALGGLEDRIARLVEKLDASEGRLGNLEAIERGMAELLVHLEGLRANPPAPPPGRAEPPPAARAAPVEVIHDVAALKQAQVTVERRTQDSLEVVHGTIETMVDRIATIETDIRKDQRGDAPALSAPPSGRAPSVPQPPVPQPSVQPPAAASAPRPAPPTTRVAGPRPAIDPSLPHDHPLEPGSGPPRPRPAGSGAASGPANSVANAADRVAASEAPLRAAKGQAPEPESKSGYLQAARQAAQFASQNAQRGEAAPAAESDALGGKLSRRLKGVFVGISVAVLIVVALRYVASYLEFADVAPADAPVVAVFSAPAPVVIAATPSAPLPPSSPPAALPANPIVPPLAAASPFQSVLPASGVLDIDRPPRQPSVSLPVPSAPPASADLARDVTGAVPAPRHAPLALPPAVPAAEPAVPAAVPAVTGPGQLPAGIGGKALIAAASAGEPAAAFEVATRFAEGRGVPQNFQEAAVWYERAAKGGLAPGLFRLGALYEKGTGVTKDLNEARRLYVAAAEKGNANAMHNLGVLYAEGIDGKPDFKSAAQWFRKSATYGLADSQYNVAVLYARGIGVERNLGEAYKWFALAAKGGDPEAGKKRDEIGARLDPQMLAATRRAAETWVSDRPPEDAVTVTPPAGGWDQVEPVAKLKPRPRAQSRPTAAPL